MDSISRRSSASVKGFVSFFQSGSRSSSSCYPTNSGGVARQSWPQECHRAPVSFALRTLYETVERILAEFGGGGPAALHHGRGVGDGAESMSCSAGDLALLMTRLAAPSFRGAGMRLGARRVSPCFFQGERRSAQNVPAVETRKGEPAFCVVAGTSAGGRRSHLVRLSTATLSPPWPGSWLSGLTLSRAPVARIWSGQGWSCQPLRPAIRPRMAGHFVPAVPTGPFPSRLCFG